MEKTIGDITIQMIPGGLVRISKQDYGTLFLSFKVAKEIAAELTRLTEKKIE